MGLRVLVAPQEFKGSLTAGEAAAAIAEGIRDALGPDASIRALPLGDGGPGTVDACLAASEAERVTVEVGGPLGGRRAAGYALLRDSDGVSAVIESAAACGLVLTPAAWRTPPSWPGPAPISSPSARRCGRMAPPSRPWRGSSPSKTN